MVAKPTNALENLQESIAAIFDQAQLSLANHRKNCVALHKLHQQAGAVTRPAKKGTTVKLVGERAFGDVFIDLVNRVLVVKKGPVMADRVVKFVGSYVKFMNEKASVENAKSVNDPSTSASARSNPDEEDEDTVASRFVSRLLKWLLQGFIAKNKATRYRAVCVVSEMISHLGEIDEDTYGVLRDSLIDRLCDKESLIRSHAIIALSKLIGSDDPNEIEPGGRTILEVLLDVLNFDSSAEVRRAALLHVPLTQNTLATIMGRTRDTDPVTRKLVYSAVLQPKLSHPQLLTISQREQIVKDGLGDREPAVRVAAGKMVASWFDTVVAEVSDAKAATWVGDDGGIMKGFIRFLSLFDVVGPGEAVAVDAMLSIFVLRPGIPDVFVFPDEFWKTLTPESAVLARVFIEHCLKTQNETRLEAASLPVVTAFAFHLQETYNILVDILQEAENARFLNAGQDEDEEEAEQREEELAKGEVILSELLRMALKLDYMDEIGRRKVFSVVRDMLAHPELPPGLIAPCLDVLKEITPSERDFIRVVVEVIIELREDEDDPENHDNRSTATFDDSHSDIASLKDKSLQRKKARDEMTPEERMAADVTDLRCLTLSIGMLERVHGSFEDNSTLEGILADLIIPSVKRKELVMREKGLISLGLCCLIAKNMALGSFQLFLGQAQSAPEGLKSRVLRIIFDILFLYDQDFFGRSDEVAQQIIDFLLHTLEADDSASVQAVLCIGLSKLILSGIITDPRVLMCLVLTYVSPATASNQELRQCLSYFFPVYSYSASVNQFRMQSIFIASFDLVTRIHEELDEGQEMITPFQFALLMVDWTNPQKAVEVAGAEKIDQGVHIELAIDVLAALYDSERSAEVQKILCQTLSHLYIVPGLEQRAILKLKILLDHHNEQSPFNDSALDKIFDRFKAHFTKILAKDIKRIDPTKFRDKEFQELYEFIGVDIPEEGDDIFVAESTGPSRDQSVENEMEHSESPSSTEEDVPSSPTPSPKKNRAERVMPVSRKTRQPRTSTPDSQRVVEEASELATPIPATITPKKKGVKRFHTPGSGRTPASPMTRKRTRIKSPLKSRLKDRAVTSTDSEDSSTPRRSEWQPDAQSDSASDKAPDTLIGELGNNSDNEDSPTISEYDSDA